MARRLSDGSIELSDGRIVYANSVILAKDICELVPMLCPPAESTAIFPGLFRGGSGGSGGAGFGGGGGGSRGEQGPSGIQGPPGPSGPPGPINQVQDEGSNLPVESILNFIGNGVDAVDNPGTGSTDITINDLFASTRIVSNNPAEGTDLTIQDAIDNLPAGGDIYVKPGTYVMPAALTSQPAPITIHGAGIDVTILDFGAVAGKFISIDHDAPINLRDLTIYAGGLAGQYLYDISTNYVATEAITLENVMVGKFDDTTKSIEGGFLGAMLGVLTNVNILLQNTATSWFADSGVATAGFSYIVCTNVAGTGTGAFRQKWGGFKNQTGLAAFQCLFGCANFGSLGYVFASDGTSFVGGGSTSTITSSPFSVFTGAYLNDLALVPSNDTVINACLSGIIYALTDRIIDIPAGVNSVSITGCNLASWSSEAIRNAGTKVTVSGCVGFGVEISVLEVGAADLNRYDGIGYAVSTIIGPSTLVNNENVVTVAIDTLLTERHRTVAVNAAVAPRTITLPPAADVKFIVYTIKKVDATANVVTIDPNAGELIDGALTQVLTAQWQSMQIQSDGTQWFIIAVL